MGLKDKGMGEYEGRGVGEFEGVSSTRGRPKREPSDVKSSKNFIGAWMFFAICDRPCTA